MLQFILLVCELYVKLSFELPPVRNIDAKSAVSEMRVRHNCSYFSTVAFYNLPFSKKEAYMYYCCIVRTIIDIQHYQLTALIL